MLRPALAFALLCAVAMPCHARDAKPRKWCGWYARHYLVSHDPGPAYNLARKWAGYGSHAEGPAIGALVVWAHHIGQIVGRASDGLWLVRSGNDGNRVRTRPRSVARAIAFRWPP